MKSKIIAVSDLHGYLPKDIPECGILLIGGDICPHFDRKPGTRYDAEAQGDWLDKIVRPWLKEQPAKHIVAIWGNHDFCGLYDTFPKDLSWVLLQDTEYVAEGVHIYGTPWVNRFFDWAFMLSEKQLADKFAYITEGCDILLSHGPPLWCCDRAFGRGDHIGSEALYNRLRLMAQPPKHVVCGHIHGSRGWGRLEQKINVWNVSGVDEAYTPHTPMWVELSDGGLYGVSNFTDNDGKPDL